MALARDGREVAVLLHFLVVVLIIRPQIDVKIRVSPLGAFGTCGSQEAALYAACCAHTSCSGLDWRLHVSGERRFKFFLHQKIEKRGRGKE